MRYSTIFEGKRLYFSHFETKSLILRLGLRKQILGIGQDFLCFFCYLWQFDFIKNPATLFSIAGLLKDLYVTKAIRYLLD